jgi:hypothetical protein
MKKLSCLSSVNSGWLRVLEVVIAAWVAMYAIQNFYLELDWLPNHHTLRAFGWMIEQLSDTQITQRHM